YAPGKGASTARGIDYQQALERGKDGLSAQRFDIARDAFTRASLLDPSAPEPLYYLAVTMWWMEAPEQQTLGYAEAARLRSTAPAQQTFLEGLELLVRHDYPKAVEFFRAAAQRFPDDREILYGLSEALYHGGHPGEGIEEYRRVVDAYPSFTLGLF